MKVKIYEKEQRIGGKINIIEADNFVFDLTASNFNVPSGIQGGL